MKKIKHSECTNRKEAALAQSYGETLSACKKEQWGITDAIKSQQRTTF
jgi:hypothetical protein